MIISSLLFIFACREKQSVEPAAPVSVQAARSWYAYRLGSIGTRSLVMQPDGAGGFGAHTVELIADPDYHNRKQGRIEPHDFTGDILLYDLAEGRLAAVGRAVDGRTERFDAVDGLADTASAGSRRAARTAATEVCLLYTWSEYVPATHQGAQTSTTPPQTTKTYARTVCYQVSGTAGTAAYAGQNPQAYYTQPAATPYGGYPPPAPAPQWVVDAQAQARAQIDLLLSPAEIAAFIASLKNASKTGVAAAITTSADFSYKVYSRLAAITAANPTLIPYANIALIPLKTAVGQFNDDNPATMGWLNLVNIWAFELGDKSQYNFTLDDRTTRDLMAQEGVQQARQKAIAQIRGGGGLAAVSHPWKYGQAQFYQGITEANVATSFLGSYNTKVYIKRNTDGTYTLTYQVENVTGWASGTRLRKDNDGNGTHDVVIPDKARNDVQKTLNPGTTPATLALGGNLSQTWTWTENVNR